MKTHATVRDRKRANTPDNFQTPVEALTPLWPYLRPEWMIWEPACGKGNLTRAFWEEGRPCVGTDITHGKDFLSDPHPPQFDCIVTNPPYSIKDQFLARCYEFGKPFALLMPITALGCKRRQALYRRYGIEVIFMPGRIDFETPLGRGGKGGNWFDVAWFTWKLELPTPMLFWQPRPAVAQLQMFGASTLLEGDGSPLELPMDHEKALEGVA
jgi:hypothetical protein